MIIKGDSRHIPLSGQSINCIITSPPYWSLRKYDIPDLVWDGEEGCKHNFEIQQIKVGAGHSGGITTSGIFTEARAIKQRDGTGSNKIVEQGFCSKCSAWRGQLGLEPTIDLYLKHLMQIMDECKRALRDDGTMWVNLGDSYSGSWGNYGDRGGKQREVKESQFDRPGITPQDFLPGTANCGIPPKSLCLIPERFAIAMVNGGWILRNKIIWHKPNCMPAPVKDRFTVDFEPVFFFVKSRKYRFEQQHEIQGDWEPKGYIGQSFRAWRDDSTIGKGKGGLEHKNIEGRNRRCVWTVSTQPYPESHFATFPEALIEPMIKAGCPKGGIVLDPFAGSGTVIKVAEKLQRIGIGIDLGYERLSLKRRQWNQISLIT